MITLTKDTASGLDISKDGHYLASGMMMNVVVLDIPTLTAKEFSGHTDYVTAVSFAHHSNKVASVSWDQTVRIWDCITGAELHKFTLPDTYARSVAFAKEDTQVLAGTNTGMIYAFDLATGQYQVLSVHEQEITQIISLCNRFISSAKDGMIAIWDFQTSQVTNTWQAHQGPTLSLALSKDRQTIATGGQDKMMRLWKLSTSQQILPESGHKDEVAAMVMIPDKPYLISGSNDATVRAWNLTTSQQMLCLPSEYEIACLAVQDSGNLFAVAEYNIISLYSFPDGKRIRQIQGHSDKVRWMQFTPDGTKLYAVSWDGMLALWNISTGEAIHKVFTNDSIECATLLPIANIIATGYWSGKVDLWNIETGQKLLALAGHPLAVFSIIYTPYGLLTGSEDNTVILWDIQTGEKQQEFQAIDFKKMLYIADRNYIAILGEKQFGIFNMQGTLLVKASQTTQAKSICYAGTKLFIGNQNGTICGYTLQAKH